MPVYVGPGPSWEKLQAEHAEEHEALNGDSKDESDEVENSCRGVQVSR